jgi:hypothetical protein
MDWEELQRDCHPFPAYVDYIHGRTDEGEAPPCSPHAYRKKPRYLRHLPIRIEIHWLNRSSKRARRKANPTAKAVPTLVTAPPVQPVSAATRGYRKQRPTRSSSSSQSLQDVQGPATPAEQMPVLPRSDVVQVSTQTLPQTPNNPPLQSAAPASFQPFAQAPTALHIIQPDELLEPQYDWIHERFRPTTNAMIAAWHARMKTETLPHEQRLQARNMLIQMSAQISAQHMQVTKLEAAKQNIHKQLPLLWQALKTRNTVPPGHGMHEYAGQYLVSIMSCLDPALKKYAEGIIERMIRAENEGKDAMALIPGYSPSDVNM